MSWVAVVLGGSCPCGNCQGGSCAGTVQGALCVACFYVAEAFSPKFSVKGESSNEKK